MLTRNVCLTPFNSLDESPGSLWLRRCCGCGCGCVVVGFWRCCGGALVVGVVVVIVEVLCCVVFDFAAQAQPQHLARGWSGCGHVVPLCVTQERTTLAAHQMLALPSKPRFDLFLRPRAVSVGFCCENPHLPLDAGSVVHPVLALTWPARPLWLR